MLHMYSERTDPSGHVSASCSCGTSLGTVQRESRGLLRQAFNAHLRGHGSDGYRSSMAVSA